DRLGRGGQLVADDGPRHREQEGQRIRRLRGRAVTSRSDEAVDAVTHAQPRHAAEPADDEAPLATEELAGERHTDGGADGHADPPTDLRSRAPRGVVSLGVERSVDEPRGGAAQDEPSDDSATRLRAHAKQWRERLGGRRWRRLGTSGERYEEREGDDAGAGRHDHGEGLSNTRSGQSPGRRRAAGHPGTRAKAPATMA